MTKIAQGTPIKPVVNQRVIAALRAALKDAKEGKVQAVGIAIAVFDPDGDNGRSTETILSAADGWGHSLSCAVNGLAFRLNHEFYAKGHVTPAPNLNEEDE
jgi:hypothetical protein